MILYGVIFSPDKLSARAALAIRGIISSPHSLPCAFCVVVVEDSKHLFFNCTPVKNVWRNVFDSLGLENTNHDDVWKHFLFGNLAKSHKGMKINI